MRFSISAPHLSTVLKQRPAACWLFALFACGGLALFSVLWIDRPVAEFAHAHSPTVSMLQHAARLPDGLLVMAIFAPFAAALLAGSRWPFRPLTEVATLCGFSVLWTTCTVEFLLKRSFGRSGPGAWLNDRIYTLHPFGGRTEPLRDFPSGEAALLAAVLSILWNFYPRWRALYVFVFCAESFLLVLLNWHFVSDTLAGGFVGASIGAAVTKLWRRRDLAEDNNV